jgi:hypothetical protein
MNAWRFRIKVPGRKDTFLEFLRVLVIIVLEFQGKSPIACGPKKANLSRTRCDELNHWIVGTQEDKNGKASRWNCKQFHLEGRKEMKATFVCEKCDAPLHINFFKEGFIVILAGFDPKIKNTF